MLRCGLDRKFLEGDATPVPDQPRLVCIGRLCEQKGQLLLIKAAARLRDLGVRFELVLAGDGPMRSQIESAIRRYQLGDCVTITGWITSDQVRNELLQSRAMVLPSFGEGLPVVIMEALALGRPVISTYIAGIPELVRSGESGWLVPAGAVEPLVDAMAHAVTSPAELLDRMGEAGRAAVRERHDASKEAARLGRWMFPPEGGEPFGNDDMQSQAVERETSTSPSTY